jgi:hypothetical protein
MTAQTFQCEHIFHRMQVLEGIFGELKLKVQEVYCNWNVTSITEVGEVNIKQTPLLTGQNRVQW